MAGLIHLELLTDLFNKIGQKATSAGPEKFDPCLSLGAGRAVPID
jgi:hypothetical protein